MSKPRIKDDSHKIASKARDQLEDLSEKAEHYYEEGLEKAQELGRRLEDVVRDRPVRAILVTAAVAGGLGLIIGYLTRK